MRMSRELAWQIIGHVRREAPKECVGFLFGEDDRIVRVMEAKNVALHPTTEYVMDPNDQVKGMRDESLIGIYHSHPRTDAWPSGDDWARNQYPDLWHVIVTPLGVMRAFKLEYCEVKFDA